MNNMYASLKFSFYLFFTCCLLLCCNTPMHNENGVIKSMQKYDALILKLDAPAIAQLFTPDGNLGDIAIGRDSIKKFLSSFKNIKVLSQSSTTTSIKINNDTALQKGLYYQTDLLAAKDTAKVKGAYMATWQWMNKKWLIKKMVTKSLN